MQWHAGFAGSNKSLRYCFIEKKQGTPSLMKENTSFLKANLKLRLPFHNEENNFQTDIFSPVHNNSKNPSVRALNFEGQAAVGFYLMITNSNIRLLSC